MSIYDDPHFFKKYSEMLRSKEGLMGAGEWPTLKQVLPDFRDKTVLDLGCGYGWHCNYAVEKGAQKVIGIDQSEKMLQVATEKFDSPKINFIQGPIEEIRFPKNSFDVIISSLALHYVEDYAGLIYKISSMIKEGGQIVFTVEHPTFTAFGSQDWYYSEKGEILHFPVDNYFMEGKREATFLGTKMTKYHRTLTTYLEILRKNGFAIDRVIEPKPIDKYTEEGFINNEMRRPMMLIISATREKK